MGRNENLTTTQETTNSNRICGYRHRGGSCKGNSYGHQHNDKEADKGGCCGGPCAGCGGNCGCGKS